MNKFLKWSSVLRVSSMGLLTYAILLIVIDQEQLAEGEGWGMIALASLICLAVIGLLLDLLLRAVIPDRKLLNIVEAVLIPILVYWLSWR